MVSWYYCFPLYIIFVSIPLKNDASRSYCIIPSRPTFLLHFLYHSVFQKSQSRMYQILELFVHSGKKVGRNLSVKSIIKSYACWYAHRNLNYMNVLYLINKMRIPWCKFICCQRTGSGCETACDDDSFLSIPWSIICHYFGMCSDVLWGQLWQLIRLCVYPTQWFHLLDVLMLWQLGW
jgi:hypothetical protein